MTPTAETKQTGVGDGPPWPKHPDGRNKRMGEMTSEERRAQIQASAKRIADGLYKPRAAIAKAARP